MVHDKRQNYVAVAIQVLVLSTQVVDNLTSLSTFGLARYQWSTKTCIDTEKYYPLFIQNLLFPIYTESVIPYLYRICYSLFIQNLFNY